MSLREPFCDCYLLQAAGMRKDCSKPIISLRQGGKL